MFIIFHDRLSEILLKFLFVDRDIIFATINILFSLFPTVFT